MMWTTSATTTFGRPSQETLSLFHHSWMGMPRPLPCRQWHRTSWHQVQHLLLTPTACGHSPVLQEQQPNSIHPGECCHSLQPQPTHTEPPQHHSAGPGTAHNLRRCSMWSCISQTPPLLDQHGAHQQPAANHHTLLPHPWTLTPSFSMCSAAIGPRPLSPGVRQKQSSPFCAGQHTRPAHPSASHPGVPPTQLQLQTLPRWSTHWGRSVMDTAQPR